MSEHSAVLDVKYIINGEHGWKTIVEDSEGMCTSIIYKDHDGATPSRVPVTDSELPALIAALTRRLEDIRAQEKEGFR